jgi:hypothetical protein
MIEYLMAIIVAELALLLIVMGLLAYEVLKPKKPMGDVPIFFPIPQQGGPKDEAKEEESKPEPPGKYM